MKIRKIFIYCVSDKGVGFLRCWVFLGALGVVRRLGYVIILVFCFWKRFLFIRVRRKSWKSWRREGGLD